VVQGTTGIDHVKGIIRKGHVLGITVYRCAGKPFVLQVECCQPKMLAAQVEPCHRVALLSEAIVITSDANPYFKDFSP
jgi:hypothetical protein